MNATQNWTAAEVVDDWCHRHGYDLMDIYEAQSLLAALAEAGYTIVDANELTTLRGYRVIAENALQKWREAVGPGQVIVDRERWERVRSGCTSLKHWLMIQPGDLDPLPTREGE